ncbi:rCG54594, isoform CRA_f [Rattus norvegicus]|uniref:RCG54594, isoform CRA_f n=1 Tax=Rattus norvegicus TaxID=10116 RepID=A6JAY5_RAT|nr:rCG54594, isoform CRA_f [Rattus norvegicus]
MQEAWGSRRRKRTHIKGGSAGRRGTGTSGEGAAGYESKVCPSVTSKTLPQA